MRLNLDPSWIERMASLPESGMGYQRVRVLLRNGRTIRHATVLNAQVLQVDDSVEPFATADITDLQPE